MARVRLQWKDRHGSYTNENNTWTQVAVTIWHSGDAIVGLLRFLLQGHRPMATERWQIAGIYRRTDFYERTNAQYLFNAGRHLAIISYINPLKLAPTKTVCQGRIRPTQFRTRKESHWARRITTNPSRDSLPLSNFRKKKEKNKETEKRKQRKEQNKKEQRNISKNNTDIQKR